MIDNDIEGDLGARDYYIKLVSLPDDPECCSKAERRIKWSVGLTMGEIYCGVFMRPAILFDGMNFSEACQIKVELELLGCDIKIGRDDI